MKTILIASKNSAKIEGARAAFAKLFPAEEFNFLSKPIPADLTIKNAVWNGKIPDQPRTEQETRQCAYLRLRYLMDTAALEPEPRFYVAIESGVADHDNELIAFTWAAISYANTLTSYGRSASFILPPRVVEEMRKGHTMVDAIKLVYPPYMNPNAVDGLISILSDGALTRSDQISSAVMMALLKIKNPHLYEKNI